MKKYLTIITTAMFLSATNAHAQMPYKLTTQSQPYTPLTGATSLNSTMVWADSNDFIQPLGFNFELGGKTITKLNLLGENLIANDTTDKVSAISLIGASLVDRGAIGGTTKSPIRYTSTGAAGHRIFKLEMFNAGFFDEQDIYSTLNDSLNLQVWLYEDSSIIELRFGPSKISHADDYFPLGGPMLGYVKNLVDSSGDFDKFYLLKGNPALPTIDSVSSFSASMPVLTAYPANGTVYRLTPKKASTAVNDVNAASALKVYPTVCAGNLFVDNEKEATSYKILGITGTVLQSGTINNGHNSLDLSMMPAGNYMIAVKNDIAFNVFKFVKQ